MEMRITSLGLQLMRVQQGLITQEWIPRLFDQYDRLLHAIANLTTFEIIKVIQETENSLIEFLMMNFHLPGQVFSELLASARSSLNQSVDAVLPRMIANKYRESQLIKGQTLNLSRTAFLDFWSSIAEIFTAFQITPNHFVKCVAKKTLCINASQNDNECLVELSKLEDFMGLFFGSISNYKFYSKIAMIYSNVFERISRDRYNQRLSIALTSVRKDYTGPQTLELNKYIEIGPAGLLGPSNRGDGLVIFGRHSHADIVFPESEKYVDLVSLLLYNGGNNYYLVDCSKRGCCGLKIKNELDYLLRPGCLVNLAKNLIFNIEKIDFEQVDKAFAGDSTTTYAYEEEEKEIHSTITLHCLDGPYLDNKFRFSTRTREGPSKPTHMLGCGGGGEAPDFFLPKETGVSRRHCDLNFKNNEWHIYDSRSLNGTFQLLKTFDQYQSKRHSNAVPLFESEADGMRVILLSKYTFIVGKT